jgi:shikimate dehydrogenase
MTDRYAVVGNPIAQSKSPVIHAEFARELGEDMSYEAILASRDEFAGTVMAFRASGGKGMNVTIPFKLEAFELATQHSERAREAQAVNTLKFEGGVIFGDNTDGAGLVQDLLENLGFLLHGKRILLMGAGGAARGVVLPLLGEGPALLAIANRTAETAVELQKHFSARGNVRAGGYADLRGEKFDLIVNSTSTSLTDEVPSLPPGIFARGSLAYDMVYGKGLTSFLTYARENGAERLEDGLGMLVGQAAESFYLWRGLRPATRPVLEMLRAGRHSR